MASAAPIMNTAPVVILSLVKRSDLTWAVRTLPEIRFPAESSSLTVTVASPIEEGIRVCQIIPDSSIDSDIFWYSGMPSRFDTSWGSTLSL